MNSLWSQGRYFVSKINAYFITIMLVVLFSIIRIWPFDMLSSYNPYLTYYPAVIIAAVIGGFFAGLLATTLSCLIVSLLWWLLVNEPFIKVPSDWLGMTLFAFSGILISSIAESMRRTNERLQLERKQLEFSLNVSQQGYWDLNLQTNVTKRSLLHDQIFGYTSLLPEWTYELFLSHVHADDSRFVDEAFKTALTHHEPWELQCRIYRADDKSIRWIWASGEQVKIGKNNHMLGLVQDITQRKNDELSLLQYAAIIESTNDAILSKNLEGGITSWNGGAERIFGYTRDEVMGQPILMLIPEEYRQEEIVMLEKVYRGEKVDHYETVYRHEDGKLLDISLTLSPIRDLEGFIIGASMVARDITKHKQADNALKVSELRFRTMAEAMPHVVWITRPDGWNIYFNQQWVDYTGLTLEESYGHGWNKPFHPDDQHRAWDAWQQALHNNGKYSLECRLRRKDGIYRWWLVRGVPLHDESGNIIQWFGTCTDINDIKQAENALEESNEKLKHLAEHDPLTGLINRPLFADRIEQGILLSKRQKETMAVCFMDIDDFKQINDQYGHATGDLLLCAATKRLQTCIRESDTLARVGGDEFALILLGLKKEQDVVMIAKKMIQRFSEEFLIENKTLKVTLSIGISLYPRDGHKSLIEKADSAMYYVKNHGKNNFKLFDTSLQLGGGSEPVD